MLALSVGMAIVIATPLTMTRHNWAVDTELEQVLAEIEAQCGIKFVQCKVYEPMRNHTYMVNDDHSNGVTVLT